MTGTRGPIGQTARQAWLKGSRRAPQPPRRAPATRLTMPAELTGDAAAYWREVVPKLVKAGMVNELDKGALSDMCVCWARVQECEREIARDGVTVEGYRGSKVRHPSTITVKAYRESLQKYQMKFGLTALDRPRVPEPEPEPETALTDVLFGKVRAQLAQDQDEDPRDYLREEVQRANTRTG